MRSDQKGTKSVVFDDLLLLEIDPELFSLLYKEECVYFHVGSH